MELGVFLLAAGVLSVGLAAWVTGWAWLLLWPGLSLFAGSLGYLVWGGAVFGKRPDGSRALWSAVLMAPYILSAWIFWWLARLVRREPCFNELRPKFFIGRRPRPNELPHETEMLVDLTAELWEPAANREGRTYQCLPVLDGGAPGEDDFVGLIEQLKNMDRCVYVHCAEGHGRAGTVAVGLLIAWGEAPALERALVLARERRPGIRLSRAQRALIRRVTPRLRS